MSLKPLCGTKGAGRPVHPIRTGRGPVPHRPGVVNVLHGRRRRTRLSWVLFLFTAAARTVRVVSELLRLALVGIAGGFGAFVVIMLPAMWLQRRRFGRVRPLRLVGVAVICVYTMSLAGMTIAPAYDVAQTCRDRAGGVLRLDPFHSLAEVLGLYRGGAGLLELASSFPVLQILMNGALFVPLGVILRGVFRQDTTTSLALAVMLSALIEVTQYTGAWGLYPCGVRIADIEDLIANSLGAWAGALIAPVLTWLRVPLFTREDRVHRDSPVRADSARSPSGVESSGVESQPGSSPAMGDDGSSERVDEVGTQDADPGAEEADR